MCLHRYKEEAESRTQYMDKISSGKLFDIGNMYLCMREFATQPLGNLFGSLTSFVDRQPPTFWRITRRRVVQIGSVVWGYLSMNRKDN